MVKVIHMLENWVLLNRYLEIFTVIFKNICYIWRFTWLWSSRSEIASSFVKDSILWGHQQIHQRSSVLYLIIIKYGIPWWLLRVPWTARRSNQSILKEVSPEYLLEGLMLKLKFQYFGHVIPRTDSLKKTLMLGRIEGRRWWGRQVGWHHQLAGHEFEQAWRFGDGQGRLMCYSPCGCNELNMTERLNWTDRSLIIALPGVSASGQTICFNEKGFLFLAYQKNSVNFKRVDRSWLENKPQLTPN